MCYGLLLLGLAMACSAEICDKILVTVFDGAPPQMIQLVEKTMKTKLGPKARIKLIVVSEDPQDGWSAGAYLRVIGAPTGDSMWELAKSKVKKLMNVPIQKPFAKSRECEKKGFKVYTQYPPLSYFYKLAKEQGLM